MKACYLYARSIYPRSLDAQSLDAGNIVLLQWVARNREARASSEGGGGLGGVGCGRCEWRYAKPMPRHSRTRMPIVCVQPRPSYGDSSEPTILFTLSSRYEYSFVQETKRECTKSTSIAIWPKELLLTVQRQRERFECADSVHMAHCYAERDPQPLTDI